MSKLKELAREFREKRLKDFNYRAVEMSFDEIYIQGFKKACELILNYSEENAYNIEVPNNAIARVIEWNDLQQIIKEMTDEG